MIYLTGYGQMCNNMLQFGHVYAFAKEHKVKVIGLRFCYKYLYFQISNQKGYNLFTYIFAKYAAKMGLIKTIIFDNEVSASCKKNKLLERKDTFVDGWYLREYDLFLKYQEDLKKLFAFKKSIKKIVNVKLNKHQNIKVGLHVRRGDYIRWHDGKYFYSDVEYLDIMKSLLIQFKQKVDVIIFTNDTSLNRDIYRQTLKDVEITFSNGNQAEDLCYLSNCDYILGPPSTYSLMASFYNHSLIYWIYDKYLPINLKSFKNFEYYFKNII